MTAVANRQFCRRMKDLLTWNCVDMEFTASDHRCGARRTDVPRLRCAWYGPPCLDRTLTERYRELDAFRLGLPAGICRRYINVRSKQPTVFRVLSLLRRRGQPLYQLGIQSPHNGWTFSQRIWCSRRLLGSSSASRTYSWVSESKIEIQIALLPD